MSLEGGYSLTASVDDIGRTCLRKQSFSAPIHISKPHHDEGWLVVNLASPSPGLLAGDRVQCRAEVEAGARLLLTTPSASRIHAMKGGCAELHQEFVVRNAGWLDVWPEYLIPQAASRYSQRTTLHVEDGGTLIWVESLAPGRVASGEVFAFDEVALSMDVFFEKQPLARERYRLRAGDPSTQSMLRVFPTPYYASVLCINPRISSSDAVAQIHRLHDGSVIWVGCTDVHKRGVAVKLIAADSPALRVAIQRARDILYSEIGSPQPQLRRVTGGVS